MSTKIRTERVENVAIRLTGLWNHAQREYTEAVKRNDQLGTTWNRSRALAFEQALEVLFDETGDAQ